MAEISLTAADLKARYPEFNAVSDTYIEAVLSEAALSVDETWIATDRVPATLALAAHMMTLEGEPARTANGGVGGATAEVKRVKVGDVETEFNVAAPASGAGGADDYGSSLYGAAFLRYRRRSFPGIIVV